MPYATLADRKRFDQRYRRLKLRLDGDHVRELRRSRQAKARAAKRGKA